MTRNTKELLDFYHTLDDQMKRVPASTNPCGDCNRCCNGFYLFLTAVEYEVLVQHLEQKGIEVPVRFQRASIREIDRPEDPGIVCPFYRKKTGCLAYEVRPLPCRLYGYYTRRGTVHFEGCVYREPVPYESVEELPFWKEYVKVLTRCPAPSGFILPDY